MMEQRRVLSDRSGQTLIDLIVVGKPLATSPSALFSAPPTPNNPPAVASILKRFSSRYIVGSSVAMPVTETQEEAPAAKEGETGVTLATRGLQTTASDTRQPASERGRGSDGSRNGGRGRKPSPVGYFWTENPLEETLPRALTVEGGKAHVPDTRPGAKLMGTPAANSGGKRAAGPTDTPEAMPMKSPTPMPTATPVAIPTGPPASMPAEKPASMPTGTSTTMPTAWSRKMPTAGRKRRPEAKPTETPTAMPTETTTAMLTEIFTAMPAGTSTAMPTETATAMPTETLTAMPTGTPTAMPTGTLTGMPTRMPATDLMVTLTAVPTGAIAAEPTEQPATISTALPTVVPTGTPAAENTVWPLTPTRSPTAMLSVAPAPLPIKPPPVKPTISPTAMLTAAPAALPIKPPPVKPTISPTAMPIREPTALPMGKPTVETTGTPTPVSTGTPAATPTESPAAAVERMPTGMPFDLSTADGFQVTAPGMMPPTPSPIVKTPVVAPSSNAPAELPRGVAPSSNAPAELPRGVAPTTAPSVEAPVGSPSTTSPMVAQPNAEGAPAALPTAEVSPVISPNTVAPVSAPIEDSSVAVSGAAAAWAVSFLAAGGAAIAVVSNMARGQDELSADSGGNGNSQSVRSPSATLVVVAVTQVQFLATTSLVDSGESEATVFSDFTDNLRWVNLWPPTSFTEEFIDTSGGQPRRLQEVETSSVCAFEGNEASIALVFIGNLALVLVALLAIFLIHVTLVSGIQAYWLAKQRANMEIEARRRGVPSRDISVRHLGGRLDHDAGTSPSASTTSTDSGQVRGRTFRKRSDWEHEDEVEEGGRAPDSSDAVLLNPVAECRGYSQSAWLHFPHIELMFLFFAFEGAVASELSVLREGGCPAVYFTAAAALLLYPVLMFAMVCRTVLVRVLPNTLIVFKPTTDAEDTSDGSGGRRSFFSRVKAGWDEDQSIFAWGNKGAWETVETTDDEARREGDWFRIGFEPLFVDFTKDGSWFVVFSLLEWTAIACIGVFVDSKVLQLFLFGGLHSLSFIVLVTLKPFANRVVNAMGVCLVGIDAICMILLAVAALKWEGNAKEEKANKAVMIMQVLALVGLIIPVYVDTSLMIMAAIRSKMQNASRKERSGTLATGHEERVFVRRYIRQAWAGIWCTMLRYNVFACVRDTSDGVRQPRNSQPRILASRAAAPVHPSPAMIPSVKSDANDVQRWPDQLST